MMNNLAQSMIGAWRATDVLGVKIKYTVLSVAGLSHALILLVAMFLFRNSNITNPRGFFRSMAVNLPPIQGPTRFWLGTN